MTSFFRKLRKIRIEFDMGNSNNTPSYSWAGLVFGQAMNSSNFCKPLDFPKLEADLKNMNYVVTGGSAGIGAAVTKFLYNNGANVFILCRNVQKGQETVNNLTETYSENPKKGTLSLHKVDCSSPDQIAQFAKENFDQKPLHGLINNAGQLITKRVLDEKGIEAHVGTHIIGIHALTKYLLPSLRLASETSQNVHVINVASGGLYTAKLNVAAIKLGFSTLEKPDKSYDGALAYAVCKRAQLELTKLWAIKLEKSEITVSCMHPGWAKTDALEGLFELHPSYRKYHKNFRTPDDGADTINWL